MAEFILMGGRAKCPACGEFRFSGPEELSRSSTVICLGCGYISVTADLVKEAQRHGRGEPSPAGPADADGL